MPAMLRRRWLMIWAVGFIIWAVCVAVVLAFMHGATRD
jgi:hypothetical protein